jgi:hypothetical protein
MNKGKIEEAARKEDSNSKTIKQHVNSLQGSVSMWNT